MASVSHPSQRQTPKPILPQTKVLDEPDTSDTDNVYALPNEDSDGSDVEILDGGSDIDICEETELAKFSQMLHEAQKEALTKEQAKGNKWKTYSGRSRTTKHHQKHLQIDLAT